MRLTSSVNEHMHIQDRDPKNLTMATAAAASILPSNGSGSGKAKRKRYAREFKLTIVVSHYSENNLYQTSKRFSLNTNKILRWVADGEAKKAKKGSKCTIRVRKAVSRKGG